MPSPRLRVSLIVIGDEILAGFVRDTNSGWLAERLRGLGVPLERIVTVADDVGAIGEALHDELARPRPRAVVTSGGIGTTPDDLTLEAVAAALDRDLAEHPVLAERVDTVVAAAAARGAPLSEAHARSLRKMARVPAGATLLPGASGVAPGVVVELDGGLRDPANADGAAVVVLPGVPGEFRRLVEHAVEPALLAGRGAPVHVAELHHEYPESALTPVLDEVAAAYPGVAVGSYPGRQCTVRISGERAQVEEAMARVRGFVTRLDAEPAAARARAAWRAGWGDPQP